MLKPFKSFLTYLQKNKNAGTSTIGLNATPETTGGDNDNDHDPEHEPEPCQEILIVPTSCDDPLNTSADMFDDNDPLALATDPFSMSSTSLIVGDDQEEDEERNEHVIPPAIVIVDVNSLKNGEILDPSETPDVHANSETDLEESFIGDASILESIPNDESQEERSDGSDSGIGPEPPPEDLVTSLEHDKNDTTSTSGIFSMPSSADCSLLSMTPSRSSLKRRSADTTDGPEQVKRPKRSIAFDGVTVYYFPRIQGFACVPSQGGCTLGMGSHHVHTRKYTLAEHAAEQRRQHRQLNDLNPKSSSSDESDSDDEVSDQSGSEFDSETNGFLQPVTTKQRRALLKAAGVRKIDTSEKDECRTIRSSREFCGCNCRGYCDPDTCFCSQSGIKCQVDRPNFPCGCTRDGCGNVVGRVEFNPARVRTHFIHTIMRLELEKKQEQGGGVRSTDEIDLGCGTQSTNRTWMPQMRLPDAYNVYSSPNSVLTTPEPSTSAYHPLELSPYYRDDYPGIVENRITHPSFYHGSHSFNQHVDYGTETILSPNTHIRFDTSSPPSSDDPPTSIPSTSPASSSSSNFLHSSVAASMSGADLDFDNLNPPANRDAITDLLHHNRYSPTLRCDENNVTDDIATIDQLNNDLKLINNNCEVDREKLPNNTQAAMATGDIMKKSIVETVLA